MQLSSQLEPVRVTRAGLGAGGGGPQVLRPKAGDTVVAQAVANGVLSIYVPSQGQRVSVSFQGAVKSEIPLSCPNPCQVVLDGTPGTITFQWTDTTYGPQNVVVNVASAPSTQPSSPTKKTVPIPYVPGKNLPTKGSIKAGGVGPTAGASSTTSTGTKVAVATGAVAGVSILTLAIISAATGWGVQKTLDKAWDKLSGKKSR